MMRNLKILGLALVAILAAAAAVATAASANQFHSAAVNTTWTRSANVAQRFQYAVGGQTVECGSISGSGNTAAQTVNEVPFSPSYANCSVGGIFGSQAQVIMNGCQYLLTIEAAANQGPVHIKCPANKHIEIIVKVFGVELCAYHIAEQTPMGKADYSNSIATRIDVEPTLTGIVATRQGAGECGAANSNAGSYTGRVELMGEETGTGVMKAVQVG